MAGTYSSRHKVIPFLRGAIRGEPLVEVARTGLALERRNRTYLGLSLRQVYLARMEGDTPNVLLERLMKPQCEREECRRSAWVLEHYGEFAARTRADLTLTSIGGFVVGLGFSALSIRLGDISKPYFSALAYVTMALTCVCALASILNNQVWRRRTERLATEGPNDPYVVRSLGHLMMRIASNDREHTIAQAVVDDAEKKIDALSS